MDVRVGGRGLTIRAVLSSMRSSTVRSSPVTGSVPWSAMYVSMSLFSKTLPLHVVISMKMPLGGSLKKCLPLLREATGC